MKKILYRCCCLLILSLTSSFAFAQILDSENKLTIPLDDSTTVTLYGAAKPLSDEPTKEYYYLPCNLRLAKKADGTPQFLFLKYTSEEGSAAGGLDGALLHLLMEYGLTPKQEQQLGNILRSRYEDAVLKGAARVEADGDNSLRIISATLTNRDRTRTLVTSGRAPILPGNKIAIAADLDAKGAQLMAGTLEKARSIADLSITLSFRYDVRFPAARGYIEERWDRIDSLHLIESTYIDIKDKGTDYEEKILGSVVGGLALGPIGAAIGWAAASSKTNQEFTHEEMHDLYHYLEENDIIDLRFEENLTDERIDKVREAFFQHFLDSFTEKEANTLPPPPGNAEKQARQLPEMEIGDTYRFKQEFAETIVEKRVKRFNLNYALAVSQTFQLTENLASWYDNVRDNERCVNSITLNDPFFQHRDINVILDLDAEDMMGKELNYVTVNLRKQREAEGAHDFNTAITFDRSFFETNGNRITRTYSKGKDDDPERYEYKVQWSLRGGNVYPQDTTWTEGDWQGITLAPPVRARQIRFEADLDDLQDLGIRNVTLQLRYRKFDREIETNMSISLYSKTPYAEKTIYMDKDTRGYAYRLVFTHERKGVLAMSWESKINTEYVFAVVPDELRDEDESFIDQAIQAGREIIGVLNDRGEVKKEDEVLDKFKEVLEPASN